MKTVDAVTRITIAQLVKGGVLDNRDSQGTISGANWEAPFHYDADKMTLTLGGYRYRIEEVPSNLGRGHLLYFLCPFTNRRSRTLYRPSLGYAFAHRTAFRPNLGYVSQLAGRRYHLNRSHQLQAQCDDLAETITRWEYAGRPTKRARHWQALQDRADDYWYRALLANPLIARVMAEMK